jgi:hypothetical protein
MLAEFSFSVAGRVEKHGSVRFILTGTSRGALHAGQTESIRQSHHRTDIPKYFPE